MFDKLFKRRCAIARQREAPLASERASFLVRRAEDEAAPDALVHLAQELLVVVQELELTSSHLITLEAVQAAAGRGSCSCKLRRIGCGSWVDSRSLTRRRSPLPRW